MVNREQWLTEVAEQVRPIFLRQGFKLGDFRVTCGWPCRFATSLRGQRVGECHSFRLSKAGVAEVFISPTLDEPLKVAGTLCHELVHVSVGTEAGHKGPFTKACRYIGLVGRPTIAMPGAKLNEQLSKIIETIGEYPHKALTVERKLVARKPPAVKLYCGGCGCEVSIPPDWLISVGPPTCACGVKFSTQQE